MAPSRTIGGGVSTLWHSNLLPAEGLGEQPGPRVSVLEKGSVAGCGEDT